MEKPLSNRTALVTGASRGIGEAIAAELARQGATVVGTATTEAGAKQITDRFASEGLSGFGHVLELGQSESIQKALDDILGQIEAPTILVNNAGITRDGLLLRMSEDDWAQVLTTNLQGAFSVTKKLLRGMAKARWGRVINVSSVVARAGNPGQANYCAAKAGLEGFTRSLAMEMANRNITANSVAPGFIDTDMTRSLNEEQRARILDRIPAGRLGNPQEVAAVVAFLASEAAAYVTGQTIQVNGGLYMG